jgi:hypothetical protein
MSENDTIGSDSDATTTPAASTGTDDGSTTSNTRSDDQGRHDTATVEGATNPDEPSAVTGDTETDPGLLEARLEVLREENERLRREYARARRSQYRQTAIGLGVLGTLAAVAAILFPEQSPILLALGGTGLFGAVLTYYLTPEQFVPATVGERIHRAHTANQAALIDDLGLQDDRLYVPTPERETMARLFVPQRADHELPPADVLDHLLLHDGPAFWIDADGHATTTTFARIAPSQRLLDRIHVARGFTAYQHYGAVRDLSTAVNQSIQRSTSDAGTRDRRPPGRDDDTSPHTPSLIVAPALDAPDGVRSASGHRRDRNRRATPRLSTRPGVRPRRRRRARRPSDSARPAGAPGERLSRG